MQDKQLLKTPRIWNQDSFFHVSATIEAMDKQIKQFLLIPEI